MVGKQTPVVPGTLSMVFDEPYYVAGETVSGHIGP